MYNVIVADDEDIIRKGIVELIDWNSLNCQVIKECVNGLEVLEFLEYEKVDIVITDIKMPGMDGLSLLQTLFHQKKDILVIVLTAYSEFSNAQSAIRYGAVDYVVKNDFIQDLPGAIMAAIIRKDEAEKNLNAEESGKGDAQRFAGYLLETLALSRVPGRSEDITEFGLDKRIYCVCSCEIIDLGKTSTLDKNVQMLTNFMNTIVNRHHYFIVNIRPYSMTLIISEDKEKGLSIKEIAVMCNEVLRITEEFMRIYLKFGISTIIDDVYQLARAYEESMKALSRSVISGNEVIFFTEENETGVSINVADYFPVIIESLFKKDLKGALVHIKEMKDAAFKAHYSLEKLKIKAINLSSSVFRKFGENYIADILGDLEDETYKKLNESTTLYSLFKVLEELMVCIDQHLSTNQYERHYLISQINEFIQKHYQENITLNDIAKAIHVSPPYVSRVYRNKTGITITDAVSQYRIEQSKKLLRNTSYKIYEIAEMVGIEDPAYFTNVFTKYTGCNPSEYRNQ